MQTWWALGLFGGFFTGLVGQEWVDAMRSIRVWPVTAVAVDWRQVDQLLGGAAPGRDRP